MSPKMSLVVGFGSWIRDYGFGMAAYGPDGGLGRQGLKATFDAP